MSKPLKEDFITTDLRALFSSAPSSAPEVATDEGDASDTPASTADSAASAASDPKAAFKDSLESLGFTADIIAKLDALGDPFKKALEVLGLDSKLGNGGNPILAFVKQHYVQNKLLKTDLLNADTFRAIYNAVAKRQVAHSEFFKVNDYNIIYCQALYKKPVSEISKYLDVQKRILKPSAQQYTQADLTKNKKAFFFIEKIEGISNKDNRALSAELNPSKRSKLLLGIKTEPDKLPSAWRDKTILNSLELAEKVAGGVSYTDSESDSDIHKNTKNINAIVNDLERPAEFFALLQYLSMTTRLPEATEALKDAKLQGLSGEAIAEATKSITSRIGKGRIPDEEAKTLVAAILGKLEKHV